MPTVLIVSALLAAWWGVSVFGLPVLFKEDLRWHRTASHKINQLVLVIAFSMYLSGGIENVATCLVNHGNMPVAATDNKGEILFVEDPRGCWTHRQWWEVFGHTCVTRDTKFLPLVDRYDFESIGYILSIGDIFLLLGTWIMTLQRIWILACILYSTKKPH